MKNDLPVAVIGAGLAGLTAAKCLQQNSVPFILYESGKKIAGLAASFTDSEGFSNDFGAHFITNRLAAAVGVSADCLLVKHYGERVWLDGTTYDYPFGLLRVPRLVASGIKSNLQRNGRAPQSAGDWFRGKYGRAMADEIALPLVEAWSGARAEDLSPAVGESLPGSILKTLYLKAAGKFLGRAVAIGYNREMPEKASVHHVYPKGGVALLCEKLADGLQNQIRLESPVEEILVENEKVVAVKAKGEKQAVSAVISTAPVNILARLIRGTKALTTVENFRYRPMVFVNMKFEGRGLLPDTVLWFPEKRFPFFRLTEATLSMPWLAPEGKTMITADIGCQMNDEYWSMDNETISALCLEHMAGLIPDAKARYLGCNVLKTPIAYPIFLNDYEMARRDLERSTGIENLLSIGRNGEFAHIFMEDVYWRTLKKVRNLVKVL